MRGWGKGWKLGRGWLWLACGTMLPPCGHGPQCGLRQERLVNGRDSWLCLSFLLPRTPTSIHRRQAEKVG